MKKEENSQFWEYVEGKPRISHTGLIYFLEENGYLRLKFDEKNDVLVKIKNNRIIEATVGKIIHFIKTHLVKLKKNDVYEVFAKGIGSYISNTKLNLLTIKSLQSDRDEKFSSNFFYNNCYCNVSKEGIKVLGYDKLPIIIWENRVMPYDFKDLNDKAPGQFEKFIKNITKDDDERLQALKSIIGYLLHRNRDKGENIAVILYDEMMSLNNLANGGTGKTLLSQALNVFRDVETFDGKEIKNGSWFKNQRLNLTTDIIVYDDLNKEISLENFYSMITSGIEVEKKRKDAFYIPFEESPKILITSNYPVKGPGGSSDKRRRHEFEIANYYDADFTPEMEFGNRFFDKYWGEVEWLKFFRFMMECVQEYLKNGLLNAPEINLTKEKLINKTSDDFVEFSNEFLVINKWFDKREFKKSFEELYPNIEKKSEHIFHKWLVNYANTVEGNLKSKSTGGDYYFIIKKN